MTALADPEPAVLLAIDPRHWAGAAGNQRSLRDDFGRSLHGTYAEMAAHGGSI
jgi:hypothetical protein